MLTDAINQAIALNMTCALVDADHSTDRYTVKIVRVACLAAAIKRYDPFVSYIDGRPEIVVALA